MYLSLVETVHGFQRCENNFRRLKLILGHTQQVTVEVCRFIRQQVLFSILLGYADSHILCCFVFLFLVFFLLTKNFETKFQRTQRYHFRSALFFARSSAYLSSNNGKIANVFLSIWKLACSSIFSMILKNKNTQHKQSITFCTLSFPMLPLTDWHLIDIFFPTHYGMKPC